MIRTCILLAYFVVGFLASSIFTAAYAASSLALKPPANVQRTLSGYVTAGAANVANDAFSAPMVANVAGKSVTVPATWRFAANAGQFAVSAVRLNPAALVTTAVAAWLLTAGVSYVEGQFKKYSPNACASNCKRYGAAAPNGVMQWGDTKEAALQALNAYMVPLYGAAWTATMNGTGYRFGVGDNASTVRPFDEQDRPADQPIAVATDADFAPLFTAPLPDAVSTQLAPQGLPLQSPTLNPAPITTPISDPYYDPVSKTYKRQIATITPGTNPDSVPFTISEQQTSAEGEPVLDAQGQPTAEKPETPDPCKENPGRIGCMEAGEPEDVDLPGQDISISINPIAFGADNAACPAPRTTTLRNGQVLSFSFAPLCTGASALRPVVLAFAWITALMIVIGAARRYS